MTDNSGLWVGQSERCVNEWKAGEMNQLHNCQMSDYSRSETKGGKCMTRAQERCYPKRSINLEERPASRTGATAEGLLRGSWARQGSAARWETFPGVKEQNLDRDCCLLEDGVLASSTVPHCWEAGGEEL